MCAVLLRSAWPPARMQACNSLLELKSEESTLAARLCALMTHVPTIRALANPPSCLEGYSWQSFRKCLSCSSSGQRLSCSSFDQCPPLRGAVLCLHACKAADAHAPFRRALTSRQPCAAASSMHLLAERRLQGSPASQQAAPQAVQNAQPRSRLYIWRKAESAATPPPLHLALSWESAVILVPLHFQGMQQRLDLLLR
eukprot:1160532-Pelagomonas_calceolata.AAC.10